MPTALPSGPWTRACTPVPTDVFLLVEKSTPALDFIFVSTEVFVALIGLSSRMLPSEPFRVIVVE